MADITLESTEAAFCEWRAHRMSRVEPIPENLWSMALALYPQYKRSAICHRLHLSGSQFKQHLERDGHARADSGFVLASREEVKKNLNPRAEVQLTLQGKERLLTLCVSVDTLPQVLPYVGALL
jgi:hypothetical protein